MFPDDELLADAVEDYYPAEDNSHASLGIPGEPEDEEDDSDDDFCILEHPDKEPEGLSHEVIIKCLTDEAVSIKENHFTVPVSSIHTRSLHLISFFHLEFRLRHFAFRNASNPFKAPQNFCTTSRN